MKKFFLSIGLIGAATLLLAAVAMAGQTKVPVCHRPPDNPANVRVLLVAAPAVAAHLAHGDNEVQDEICDGVDNNCDGQVDEDLTRPTTCGVGLCSAVGTEMCLVGEWGGDTCTPGEAAEMDACDDGLDNDCDGEVDEDACGGGNNDCCQAHGAPECSVDLCTECVCAWPDDGPYCCDVYWDGLCALIAEFNCQDACQCTAAP